MTQPITRKYIKTKFAGVFYRMSSKLNPYTGEQDRIYYFWYSDHARKGHWKTVGRQSQGWEPQNTSIARAKFLSQLENYVNLAEPEKRTVGNAVESYTEWAMNEKKFVSTRLCLYNKHLRDKIHGIAISALTPTLLSSLKAGLMNTQASKRGGKLLAPQTVISIFSFVRAAIGRAIVTGLWKGPNPLSTKRGSAWETIKANNSRLRYFTPDEAKNLLAELKTLNPQLHDMALLSLRTGLRATEIFKLKGQDVDAYADILYIVEKGGNREAVRVPGDIAAMLRAYARLPREPLFQARSGQAVKETPACFNRTVKKLNLGPDDGNSLYAVTFHTFRHTFASWLAQSGRVSLLELQKLMRHKNISMTMRYAHLLPGQESEKLSVVSSLLNHNSD
jgi:integrase